MEESHRKVLKKLRLKISGNIDVRSLRRITEELYSRGILDENDRQEILAEKTTEYKAWLLLDLLPRKGSQAFPVFLQALHSSGSIFLANAIRSELSGESWELFDFVYVQCTSAKMIGCSTPLPPFAAYRNQEGDKKRLRSLVIH